MASPRIDGQTQKQEKRNGLTLTPSEAPTTRLGYSSENGMEQNRSHHFNLWSTIGINYSSIAPPLSVGTYLAFNIGVGGGPVYIWGYLLASFFQFFVCLSLAEMASSYPHSTGRLRKVFTVHFESLTAVQAKCIGHQ